MMYKCLKTISQLLGYTPHRLFQQRKLLCQCTSQKLKDINFVLSQQSKIGNDLPISAYCGYDPTAQSLHLGNLISIIMMARLQYFLQIRPIFLLGGATGLIGDPSGKRQERKLLQQNKVSKNVQSIEFQIKNIYTKIYQDLSINQSSYGINFKKLQKKIQPLFVNNLEFYNTMSVITYLRDIGKVVRMGDLLSKEIVANRLKSQNGLSYTQFSYSILQSYDFYMLHKNYGCVLQFGGSDQWGNITNGCDLMKKLSKNDIEGYGITMPLLLTKTGQKFGKSEGNALYLSNQKTPIANIYDYLYSTPDSQIQNLLYIFTFYSMQKIQQIIKTHVASPQKRNAQKILAQKLVKWLSSYKNIKQSLIKLDKEALNKRSEEELNDIYKELPEEMKKTIKLTELTPKIRNLPDLLVEVKLCKSRNEARREIEGDGITLNGSKLSKVYFDKPIVEVFNENKLNGQKEFLLDKNIELIFDINIDNDKKVQKIRCQISINLLFLIKEG